MVEELERLVSGAKPILLLLSYVLLNITKWNWLMEAESAKRRGGIFHTYPKHEPLTHEYFRVRIVFASVTQCQKVE